MKSVKCELKAYYVAFNNGRWTEVVPRRSKHLRLWIQLRKLEGLLSWLCACILEGLLRWLCACILEGLLRWLCACILCLRWYDQKHEIQSNLEIGVNWINTSFPSLGYSVSLESVIILSFWILCTCFVFFRCGTPTSMCHFFRPSVRHAPYLRNQSWSNHNFWYTCVKWFYLLALFSFFWNFNFLGC